MKIKYQLLLCILLSPVVSWGQKVLHVQSPDMKNELQVMIGKELEIAITRNGTTVLQPSAIGMDVHFIGILGFIFSYTLTLVFPLTSILIRIESAPSNGK